MDCYKILCCSKRLLRKHANLLAFSKYYCNKEKRNPSTFSFFVKITNLKEAEKMKSNYSSRILFEKSQNYFIKQIFSSIDNITTENGK